MDRSTPRARGRADWRALENACGVALSRWSRRKTRDRRTPGSTRDFAQRDAGVMRWRFFPLSPSEMGKPARRAVAGKTFLCAADVNGRQECLPHFSMAGQTPAPLGRSLLALDIEVDSVVALLDLGGETRKVLAVD